MLISECALFKFYMLLDKSARAVDYTDSNSEKI